MNCSNPRNDLNAMALLMWELFNGFNDDLTKPEAPGKLPQRLRDLYKKIAMPSAARLDTEELLNGVSLPILYVTSRVE